MRRDWVDTTETFFFAVMLAALTGGVLLVVVQAFKSGFWG